MTPTRRHDPQLAQLAFCSMDMPLSVHFFRDILGFGDAGGRVLTGARLAQVQDLAVDEARCIIWWLPGGQEFFQVELFHHTTPPIRERRLDPAEPGWKRCSLLVPHLDEMRSRLVDAGIATANGTPRRLTCIEPGSGIPIDLIDDAQPGSDGGSPRAASVTLGVSDLSWARRAFIDALGLRESDESRPTALDLDGWSDPERPDHSRLVLEVGDVLLEIVELPDARPRAADARLSDQGFMNIAFGFREEARLHAAYENLTRSGFRGTVPAPQGMGACYLVGLDGISVELLLFPPGYEDDYGFTPLKPPRRLA